MWKLHSAIGVPGLAASHVQSAIAAPGAPNRKLRSAIDIPEAPDRHGPAEPGMTAGLLPETEILRQSFHTLVLALRR